MTVVWLLVSFKSEHSGRSSILRPNQFVNQHPDDKHAEGEVLVGVQHRFNIIGYLD